MELPDVRAVHAWRGTQPHISKVASPRTAKQRIESKCFILASNGRKSAPNDASPRLLELKPRKHSSHPTTTRLQCAGQFLLRGTNAGVSSVVQIGSRHQICHGSSLGR